MAVCTIALDTVAAIGYGRTMNKNTENSQQRELLSPAEATKIFASAKAEAAKTCRRPGCVHDGEALIIARKRLGIDATPTNSNYRPE